jgi:hypothetical protein
MTVAGSTGVTGDHEDWADWAVLGDETGRLSRGGQDDDGTSVHVKGSTDGGHGARLNNGDWALGKAAELLKVGDVGDGVLSLEAGLAHLGDGLNWVGTLGGLTGQHDTVGTIGDGVTNVGDLGTGWSWVVDHGLEHLGSTDDWLTGQVAHGDHLLLGSKDLSGWDLDTEITTGDHDTVGLGENLSKVVETLSVLDLGNDLDVLALLAEDLADGLDVLTTADEGSKDHVDVVLDTKPQVGLILLGESWKVNIGVWEVDTLLGRDLAVVSGSAADGLVVNDLDDIKGENTVVNVDDTAGLDDLGDVLVVDVPKKKKVSVRCNSQGSQGSQNPNLHVLVVAGSSILLIGGDVDLGTGRDGDISITGGVTGSDLWTLGVKGDGDLTTGLNSLGLTGVVNDGLVVLVGAVGEVHADNVQTRLAELVDGLNGVGLWANGADDGSTAVVLGWLELGVELGEPLNLGLAGVEVFESSSHLFFFAFFFCN